MRDQDVSARLGHGNRLVDAVDIGRGHEVALPGRSRHRDFVVEAQPGLLEIGSDHAFEQADGREVLDARETHLLD